MPKWLVVAKREFLTNLRRRSFLFAAFGAPLISVGMIVIVFSLISSSASGNGSDAIGYVDQSGVLASALDKPENFTAYAGEDEAQAALSDKSIAAYFVVPEDYIESGNVTLYRGGDVPLSIEDTIENYLLANLSAQLDDPESARVIQNPVDLTIRALDSGRVIRGEGVIGLFVAPFIFVIVFIIGTQTTSGYLMSGVVEEKSNRIMEILITSITPVQLLLGKIVGLGALGLVQLGIWLGAGALIFSTNQNTGVLSGVSFPPDLIVLAVIYFLLEYFLFGSLMAGIGAAVGSEQESRQIAGLFGIVLAIPFFAIVTFFEDPNGTIPVALTLIPFTAPMVVILRSAFTVIPAWQIGLSIGLMVVTTVIVVWASARIFRWTLLMYGKKPSLRMLVRALRGEARMETTATGEAAG